MAVFVMIKINIPVLCGEIILWNQNVPLSIYGGRGGGGGGGVSYIKIH